MSTKVNDPGSGHNFKAHEYSHKANNAVNAGGDDMHHNAGFHHEEAAKRHEAAAKDYKGGWFSKGDKTKFAAHTAAAAAHREAALAHKKADKGSLSEGRSMQVKVCQVLREQVMPALNAGRKKRLESLLNTSLTEARSPLMEAEDGKDHRDHMYTAMRACEDAGNEEGATGIHKLLHPDKRVEEEEPEMDKEKGEEEEDSEKKEEVEEGMGEEGPGEHGNEGPDGKGGPQTAWESRKPKRLAPTEARLTEARAKSLCKAAGVECNADLLEAMVGVDLDKGLAVLNLVKRSQATPRVTAPPRSISRHSGGIDGGVTPAATDTKGWMARLRS